MPRGSELDPLVEQLSEGAATHQWRDTLGDKCSKCFAGLRLGALEGSLDLDGLARHGMRLERPQAPHPRGTLYL